MPRRDEEKRIAFLRTLSVEDLANRRITEFSSESERHMIHAARDAMKEKNDERYMERHKKKAVVDVAKTQINSVGKRAQTEIFGKEGGLSGGMVGSWIVGGTLVGGTIAGIATRGKRGTATATKAAVQMSPKLAERIAVAKTYLGILKQKKNLKLLKPHERSRLERITERVVEKNKIISDDRAWLRSLHKEVSVRQKRQLKPFATTKAPPAKSAGNPNALILSDSEKAAVEKLATNKRLTRTDRQILWELNKSGKLSKKDSSLWKKRILRNKAAKQARETKPTKATTETPTTPPAPESPVAPPTPKPVPEPSVPKTPATPPVPKPIPKPSTPKSVSVDDAMEHLRTVRGGKIKLTIDKGDTVAFDKLAQDIVDVSEMYPDDVTQYNVMKQLAEKAAKMNKKQPNFFQNLYDKIVDLKKIPVKKK